MLQPAPRSFSGLGRQVLVAAARVAGLEAATDEVTRTLASLDPARLEPDHLAAEIIRCLNAPEPAPTVALDLQGAPRTAELLTALLSGDLSDICPIMG